MCNSLIDSTDRATQFEQVFNTAEAELRKRAAKAKGGAQIEKDMIEQFMPGIEAVRNSFEDEGGLCYYTKPLAERITVLTLPDYPAKGFQGDEVMVEQIMQGLFTELEYSISPTLVA